MKKLFFVVAFFSFWGLSATAQTFFGAGIGTTVTGNPGLRDAGIFASLSDGEKAEINAFANGRQAYWGGYLQLSKKRFNRSCSLHLDGWAAMAIDYKDPSFRAVVGPQTTLQLEDSKSVFKLQIGLGIGYGSKVLEGLSTYALFRGSYQKRLGDRRSHTYISFWADFSNFLEAGVVGVGIKKRL